MAGAGIGLCLATRGDLAGHGSAGFGIFLAGGSRPQGDGGHRFLLCRLFQAHNTVSYIPPAQSPPEVRASSGGGAGYFAVKVETGPYEPAKGKTGLGQGS